jgi:excisionase family DNA binding protein
MVDRDPQMMRRLEARRRISMTREVQPLLNVQEAAQLLSLSPNTIRQWIWQRRLPVVKLGRSVRLRREDLETLINSHRREAIIRD